MAVSTTKKVLITRFDREPLAGFVNPQSYLQAEGLELLSQGGAVSVVPYAEIKLVCFIIPPHEPACALIQGFVGFVGAGIGRPLQQTCFRFHNTQSPGPCN